MRFGDLDIAFDNRVLEPRAWTLMQAQWAHEVEASLAPGAFVELGCGAGHIGLAAIRRNERSLLQLDADAAACEIAERNAAAAGLEHRVSVRCGAFDDTLRADEEFALVIADPPYVPTAETWRYPDDPPEAIDGGADGLDKIRSALAVAASHLTPDGAVLLQAWGRDQVDETEPIADAVGLRVAEVRAHDERRAVALLRRRG